MALRMSGFVVLACFGIAAAASNFPGKQLSVFITDGAVKVKEGIDTTAVAYGSYDPVANHPSGFGVLKIETNPTANDNDQYFGAGFIEGALTAEGIYYQYTNLLSTMPALANGVPANLTKFLTTQYNWTRDQAKANANDPFWAQTGLIMAQFDGLAAGYNSNPFDGHKLETFAFQLLNGNGDFFDIVPAVVSSEQVDFDNMTTPEFHRWRLANGRCSALVKLTGDYSKLFMSHSAWYIYQAMNRIYKHYNLQASVTVAKKVSFSSYPGYLESLDDFYLMSSGLVMLQTTNNVFNTDLQQYIKPQSLQAWIRVRVASALAKTAEDWAILAGRENSGTYNNQYMVVDLNKFTPGQPLPDKTLYVAEQIPGTWEYGDETRLLSLGYWPSYNVPYFEKIYNLSGYPEVVAKHGTGDSYQLAPRAKIFRRDQTTVTDLDSFKAIMRYNDYKNDPYANGDPYAAICSRGDLASNPSPGGCYDTKVTTYEMALKLQSEVINGPTTSHGIPPFSWDQFPSASHLGMPTVFNYSFEFMDPQW